MQFRVAKLNDSKVLPIPNGGRGRSRTHRAGIPTPTALKAARPTGDDALPRTMLTEPWAKKGALDRRFPFETLRPI